MKANYTHLAILLDRSGSMNRLRKSIIEGFNSLISDQKKQEGELTVSLVQFDSGMPSKLSATTDRLGYHIDTLRYNVVNDFCNVNEVTELNESNYKPDGGTPLNDALALLITETGNKLANMKEEDRPEKVLVVIMTDGEENSSKEHTAASVKTMVEHQENKYNWKFIYVGTNQDTDKESSARGINTKLSFDNTTAGASAMYMANSMTISSMRRVSVDQLASTDFSEELSRNYKTSLENEK